MTPERGVEIIRLYAPILVAIFLIIVGLTLPNLGWVAVGAGALGVPAMVAGK